MSLQLCLWATRLGESTTDGGLPRNMTCVFDGDREYRKDMQTLTVAGTSLRKFERMMLFLTESGMFYSMYWVSLVFNAFAQIIQSK